MLTAPPGPWLILLSFALPGLVFALVAWLVRTRDLHLPSWFEAGLSSWSAPMVTGVISAALTLFVWRSAAEPGVIHDEQAYLLQAQIFASGRWTGEVPPLPEFFEQPHVFLEPHLAAKYPPGHSLLMVPGVWLRLPGLMPILLGGLAGGLLFAIARRLGGSMLALLTWALWSTSQASLFCRASFLSQNTSTALWLVSLWALLDWSIAARRSRLVMVFAALAWMFLTRPFTAIPLALPIVVWVLIIVRRRRLWGQVALAATVALPILAINLLWQERTLGEWFTSPYAEYSRQYFPFDKPGFGLDPTPPLRQAPPEVAWIGQSFAALHAAHLPAALPRILIERTIVLLLTLGKAWRGFLVLLFLFWAAQWPRGPTGFSVISIALLLAAYLIYAHPSAWVVYYAEIFPAFFFVASRELMRLGQTAFKLSSEGALAAAVTIALACATPTMASDVFGARREHDVQGTFHRTAARVLDTISGTPAVVFVHQPPPFRHNASLILNSPDYRTARLWLVSDRGADNAQLLQLTDRAAYRLDTETMTLQRIR